jgi:hypothetical protein
MHSGQRRQAGIAAQAGRKQIGDVRQAVWAGHSRQACRAEKAGNQARRQSTAGRQAVQGRSGSSEM